MKKRFHPLVSCWCNVLEELPIIYYLGRLVEQTKIINVNGRILVRKHYRNPAGLAKWLLTLFPPISVYYPFELDPLNRLVREEKFFRDPPPGIKTPKVYRVDYKNYIMEKEYIEGTVLSKKLREGIKKLGEVLGKMHKHDYCMGDTRLENYIYTPQGELAVIDAEQSLTDCSNQDYKSWDIILSLFFLYIENPLRKNEEYITLVEKMMESYKKHYMVDWSSIKKIAPIAFLFPFPLIVKIREILIS